MKITLLSLLPVVLVAAFAAVDDFFAYIRLVSGTTCSLTFTWIKLRLSCHSLDSPPSVLKTGVTLAFFKSLGTLSDLSKRTESELAAIRMGPSELVGASHQVPRIFACWWRFFCPI